MKVVLDYDPNSGAIRDNEGCVIGSWIGLVGHELEEDICEGPLTDVDMLIKLKKAGYTADDVIRLKIANMI